MSNPFVEDIKNQYKDGSALIKLIMINIAVFLGVHLLGLLWFFITGSKGSTAVVHWLALPAELSSILFKPWTLITYMFLHEQLMHILFNLLVLYFGGRIFLQFLSEKKLVVTYLLGGLSGGLLYVLAFNLFPVFNKIIPFAIALGASASVMAILIAAATYVPNFVVRLIFLGNVKLKYIAMVYFVLDLISIPNENAGGHIAHIGGAIFGFVFIQQIKKGKDFTLGFSRFLDQLGAMFRSKRSMRTVYRKPGKTTTNYEFNEQKTANQKKVDLILDKISRSGYDSLTADEKSILFDASKK